jgi:hypothetical protein
MSDWKGDPALGCGLMLLVAFLICCLIAGFITALVVYHVTS